MFNFIFQDFSENKGNLKAQFIILFFRFANFFEISDNKFIQILKYPINFLYKIFVGLFLTVELPPKTKIGKGLKIFHGQALVVNDKTVIGENVILRNGVVIGNIILKDGSDSKSPIIGNNVEIGSNACIIGDVKIGNNTKIGAGTIVIKDVPDNCIVVGNPARIIPNEN